MSQKHNWIDRLKRGGPAVWINPDVARHGDEGVISLSSIAEAAERLERFAPLLALLFPGEGWDGRICSGLRPYSKPPANLDRLWIKADHTLPMTGSVKARGGVHDLLCYVEMIATWEGLVTREGDYAALASAQNREVLSLYGVSVASTGNLGFSVGLVARRLGLNAEIHMSFDAQEWKKDRLRGLGAKVVEHDCDYTETVQRARVSAAGGRRVHFVDDESSRDLFTGYAVAGAETANQLAELGITPTPEQPLVVYLPCGVGGAPGGILFGLKAIFGAAVIGVFVEPSASACVFVAMAAGQGRPLSVYDLGLDNHTIADGLAVSRASALVLDAVGQTLDAVVAVSDRAMLDAVRSAHLTNGLRLEPSAAAGLAALTPFLQELETRPILEARIRNGVHLVWTTGGSLLPDAEFERLLAA